MIRVLRSRAGAATYHERRDCKNIFKAFGSELLLWILLPSNSMIKISFPHECCERNQLSAILLVQLNTTKHLSYRSRSVCHQFGLKG